MIKKLNKMGQRGFTLIEILMAILIIVILAVVGITQFQNFAADAKNAATKSNLAILRNSIGVMNALERVRCQKVSQFFPTGFTLQNNDISGCTVALAQANPAVPNGDLTAACNPGTLIDPLAALVAHVPQTYAAGEVGATSDCGVSYIVGDYLTLIPLIDHPYVQNQIPANPWSGPLTTLASNNVAVDDSAIPSTPAAVCLEAPVDTPGTLVNAKVCLKLAAAGVAGAALTGSAGAFTGVGVNESGWCYCQSTGQIWANSGSNNGLADGKGIESQF